MNKPLMRITASGASGFIGKRLVPLLEQSGHTVHILGRRPHAGLPTSARFSIWDPEAGSPPRESLRDSEAVIHLAGEPIAQRWSPEVKRRIRSSRVNGTKALVDAITSLEKPPAVLVAASAVGYYGDRGEEELTEASGPGKGFLPEVCVEWETEAMRAASLGVRVVVIRTGIALGKGGGALGKMLPPFQVGLGGPLGTGHQWMPWIHLDDLCGLYRWAVENDRASGPVNAAAPVAVRNAEFTRALGRALHRPAILPIPKFGLRLLYGEMAEVLFDSQRVLPKTAPEGGFEFKHPEIFAAFKDLLG